MKNKKYVDIISSDDIKNKLVNVNTISELKDIQLTEHFNAFEFFYSKEFEEITLSGDTLHKSVQFLLAQNLCKTHLERIRSMAQFLTEGSVVLVTSGCRNVEVHEALRLKQGMDPRIVSDHSYMFPYWPLGVGAVDFQIPGFNELKYELLVERFLSTTYLNTFGQMIYYDLPKVKFIHLSNPRTILGVVGQVITRVDSAKALRYDGKRFVSLEGGK